MRCRRGFSFLSVLVALTLVGLAYLILIGLSGDAGGNPSGLSSRQLTGSPGLSKAAACRTNRLAAAKALTTWAVSHPDRPATLDELRSRRLLVQECPDGGRFELAGGQVVCRRHGEAR